MLKEIEKIGFLKVGSWILRNGEVTLNLIDCAQESGILYAFVIDDSVKYLGKTSRTLESRMRGYLKPNPTQRTNIKNHFLIESALQDGMEVKIFALADTAGLAYGGHTVNLSDGLEPNLIRELQPEWNKQSKNRIIQRKKNDTISKRPILSTIYNINFPIKIGSAYYDQGFFNVGVAHENYFGEDGSHIHVYLESDSNPIIATINRRANTNGTPRIMAGTRYRDWVQSNFNKGEVFFVYVQRDGSIRLGPPGEQNSELRK